MRCCCCISAFLTDKPVHQQRLPLRTAAPPAGRTRSRALMLSRVGSGTRKLPSSAGAGAAAASGETSHDASVLWLFSASASAALASGATPTQKRLNKRLSQRTLLILMSGRCHGRRSRHSNGNNCGSLWKNLGAEAESGAFPTNEMLPGNGREKRMRKIGR